MESVSHGYKKGDKILYNANGFAFYVTYLGFSELNYDCFIGETEDGYIDDSWKWDEIVED